VRSFQYNTVQIQHTTQQLADVRSNEREHAHYMHLNAENKIDGGENTRPGENIPTLTFCNLQLSRFSV